MTTQLYLQKAEMQLARGMEEKALESLLAALACQDRDAVSETQVRCLLGEYWFVHQQYVQAEEQLSWISDHAERLEQDYDDLLNEEIREAEVLLGIMQRYEGISPYNQARLESIGFYDEESDFSGNFADQE